MQLFFYGTLMAGAGNAVARAAHGCLGPGCVGQVAGALYVIADPQGCYPALVPGAGWVRGMVHMALPGLDLAALDAYEGPEYRRQAVAAHTAAGVVAAEGYVWAGALPVGAQPIPHGDFTLYLRENGLRAYGQTA